MEEKKTPKKKKVPFITKWKTWLPLLIAALSIALVVYRVYSLAAYGVTTQTALRAAEYKTVKTTLLALREEVLVPRRAAGEVVPAVQDAQRVGKGDALAVELSAGQQAADYLEIQRLKKDLLRYEALRSVSADSLNVGKLDEQAEALFLTMLGAAENGRPQDAAAQKEILLNTLTARQAAVSGKPTDNGAEIAMRARLQELEARLKVKQTFTAPQAGYFAKEADGWAAAANTALAVSGSTAEIQRLLGETHAPPDGLLGKIIHTHRWYFVAVLESAQAALLKEGEPVRLLIDGYHAGFLDVTLERVCEPFEGRQAVVFSCMGMDAELAAMRLVEARVVLEEYVGLKIDRDAVRTQRREVPVTEAGMDPKDVPEDAQTETVIEKGVYVRYGNIVHFRRIDVLYETPEFVIVRELPQKENERVNAALYDEVIVQGRGLYDGRIVE